MIKKLLLATILSVAIAGCSTIDVAPTEPTEPTKAWQKKQDLMPPEAHDPKVEDYLSTVPEMDNKYLILDECFTQGEMGATIQIARLQEPNETRAVHRTSMLWVLEEALKMPEEVVDLYLKVFDFVWDTFAMDEIPGYVQWVTHNECIKQARKEGRLEPLTEKQQAELDEIESRYHHLKTSGTKTGGDGIIQVTVNNPQQQDYCAMAGEHTAMILPLKRAGISMERVMASIDTEGLDKDYLQHWFAVIQWVYTHDYDFALEYRLHATLDCLNQFDEDAPI